MDDYKQNSYRENKGYGEKIQGDKKNSKIERDENNKRERKI